MKRRVSMIAVVLVIVSGCSTSVPEMRRATVGQIRCPEDAIKISDTQAGAKSASWTAACEGKTYDCTSDETFRGVSCLERK